MMNVSTDFAMPPGLRIIFSDAADGSIAAGGGKQSLPIHHENTKKLLLASGMNPSGRTRVFVTYSPDNTYRDIVRVTDQNAGGSIKCDALYTTDIGRVITLPVADCIATVVYDPAAHMLGVLHLGRHASLAGLIEKFASEVENVGSLPRNWHVWMSPSLQIGSNGLDYFEPLEPEQWTAYQHIDNDGRIHIDIPGHNRKQFEYLGVAPQNMFVSPVDTYSDTNYFSHRAAVNQKLPERDGRMMVAAILKSTD